MHVGPKKAPKCDFVLQIEVFHLVHINAYFYSQWLKLICFSIIVLQKVSATNFAGKKQQKRKVEKTEIHKKFIKQ